MGQVPGISLMLGTSHAKNILRFLSGMKSAIDTYVIAVITTRNNYLSVSPLARALEENRYLLSISASYTYTIAVGASIRSLVYPIRQAKP